MKKLSRSMARKSLFFLVISILALLITLMNVNSVVCWVITFASIITCACLMDKANKCPHCGAIFRGMHLDKPDAGYCRSCGKLMEYDDEKTL